MCDEHTRVRGRSLRPIAAELGKVVAAERFGVLPAAGFDCLLALALREVVDLLEGSAPGVDKSQQQLRASLTCGQRFAALSIARATAGVSVI